MTGEKSMNSQPLTIVIGGASGLIGRPLTERLEREGHTVRRLVRRDPRSRKEIGWSPSAGLLDPGAVDGVDAVINLGGVSVQRIPWSKSYRKEIFDSRIHATRTLVTAMRAASAPPKTFLSASAISLYGTRPGIEITEETPTAGNFFLRDVLEAWEAEAHKAPDETRVVTLRTSPVFARSGGILDVFKKIVRRGVAGPLGGGHQYWPWIALYDEVAAIDHLLTSKLEGPVNLAGPIPSTANEIMQRLAHDMHKPYWLPAPRFALRLALKQAADELILADQKIVPAKLIADGFTWRYRTAQSAIDAATGIGSTQ